MPFGIELDIAFSFTGIDHQEEARSECERHRDGVGVFRRHQADPRSEEIVLPILRQENAKIALIVRNHREAHERTPHSHQIAHGVRAEKRPDETKGDGSETSFHRRGKRHKGKS